MSNADNVCLVTGSNSGTGYVTALELAKSGATVVMVCRNKAKADSAREAIVAASNNPRVDLLIADLAEMKQIRSVAQQFADNYPKLDVLVNNAGGFIASRRETSEGLEATFAGNYLGHFLLTTMLRERLDAAPAARIVNVSSVAHKLAHLDFDDLQSTRKRAMNKAYNRSKLAQVLFTYELADRLRQDSSAITVNALHPGVVKSGFVNGLAGFGHAVTQVVNSVIGISSEQGADTIIYLATSPEVEGVSGKYFVKRKAVRSSKDSYDVELRRRLWTESERLLAAIP
jgi:NAD(P)-dependent dehydrogenase (short-subunit alcohol dehydrogenase family)